MRLVLDTSIVSHLNHRTEHVVLRALTHAPGDLCLAPPVVAEQLFGFELMPRGPERTALESNFEMWRSALPALPWDDAASERFAQIKAFLVRSRDRTLPKRADRMDFDIAVAAIALAHECGVATDDERHFAWIPGLHVENWVRGAAARDG